MLVKGPPGNFSNFVGFFKKEVSRRLGVMYTEQGKPWNGTMWNDRFKASALPSDEAQIDAMKYVLAQGTKEHLIEKPWHWPGLHVAKYFRNDAKPLKGTWLRGSEYAKALDRKRNTQKTIGVTKRDYVETVSLTFEQLPALKHLSQQDYLQTMHAWMNEVAEETKQERLQKQATVLGRKGILRQSIYKRKDIKPLPWMQRNRVMAIWAKVKDEVCAAYLQRYYEFQQAYRDAVSTMQLVKFPPGCFTPGYALASA